MKRQVPLDNPKAILATNPILTKLSSICNAETGSKESILVSHSTPKQVAQIDYLETARSILDSIRDADDVDSADTRELELKHAQHAVSILLSNIAIDDNSDRVLAARKLADDVLKRAETLSQELQSTTHDALTHTLNESENALGISDTAAAEPTTMPDTTDTSQKDSIASLPGATIGSDSQDVQGAKSTKDQMQMYLTQAEEELGPAATSPVEPIAKDEVVGDSEDERLFAKTVRDMKHSKSAREDPLPGVAAAITTEGANASESNDPQTTQAAANEAQDGSGGNSQAALPSRSNEPVSDEEHGEESEADGSTSESDGIQTNYPRSALLMRQCLPESAWEPDEATATCHKCERRFTLFLRRHHCRRCGLVFCDSCSSKRILLASPIGPAQSGYYGSALALEGNHLDIQEQLLTGRPNVMYWQFRDHRACDPCDGAVQSLPDAAADRVVALPRDLGASGTAENAYNIFRDTDAADSSREAAGIHDRHHRHGSDGANPYTLHRRRDSSSSIRVCPVCDKDWATVWHAMDRVPGEGWQEAQERHIRECIEDTSAEMQGSHGPRHSGIRRSRSIHAQSGAGSSAGSAAARGVGVSESTSQNRRSGGGFLAFFDRISSPEPDASGSNGDSDRGQQAAGSSTTSSQPLGINTGNSSGSRSGDADESHSAHLSRSARSPMGVKYIVYKLNGDTPLLGQECAICFEDFEPGQHVARLNCLCTYHFECISQWLQRTPACPVHYE
ncbi:hypothetical protein GGI12_005168 [Dipsacomyces acuminosporus]|nr:hypothetical protein GGI12_005168 [Dipsacomyces acuminosporus]